MIKFEIKNGVLQKIKVENGYIGKQPVSGVIKIPNHVTEIAENVLDNSVVGKGDEGYGYVFLHFRGIVIPKSVNKMSSNAFKSIKIEKEIVLGEDEKDLVKLDSEEIVLYFEDEKQKQLAKSVNNQSKFNPEIPTIFNLAENNPNIDTRFFNKISELPITRNDDKTIIFNNGRVEVTITHSNYVISSLIIDNPWFGRRNIVGENASDDTYTFDPKKDKLNVKRIKELLG